MPTTAELRTEGGAAAGMWNAEHMSPTMQTLAERLRAFYGVPAGNIGAKGDNAPGHMRGAHRSRNWILHSTYCTDRRYTVTETPGNRDGGDGDWLAGMDIKIPRDALIAMCQRLDVAVRSGRLEKITEWYGNKDGDLRVDGYNNIRDQIASSDASHLWHLHMTFDRGRAGEDHSDLYTILTGTGIPAKEKEMFAVLRDLGGAGHFGWNGSSLIKLSGRIQDIGWVLSGRQSPSGAPKSSTLWPAIEAVGLAGPLLDREPWITVYDASAVMFGYVPGQTVEVELTGEQLAEISAAAQAGAEAGAPTHDELVKAAAEGAELAEDA